MEKKPTRPNIPAWFLSGKNLCAKRTPGWFRSAVFQHGKIFLFFFLSKGHGRIWSSEHHVPLHKQSEYIERLLLIAPSWDCMVLIQEHSCISQLKIWKLPELLWLQLFINILQDLYFPRISSVVSDFCLVFIRSHLVYDLEHLETNSWACQFQSLRLWQWCKRSGASWKFSCKSGIQKYKHIMSPKRHFQQEILEAAILVC